MRGELLRFFRIGVGNCLGVSRCVVEDGGERGTKAGFRVCRVSFLSFKYMHSINGVLSKI